MKLLFDENVSPKLVEVLASEYPGSTHVRDVGLGGTDDLQVWLDVGTAGTKAISALLRRERLRVESFEDQKEASLLILSLGASAV